VKNNFLLIRGAKFALVGVGGVVINQLVLWWGQESLFAEIQDSQVRLNYSLITAISLATINNFYWNQLWTWSDRISSRSVLETIPRFVTYVCVSGVAIGVQFALTKIFVTYGMHYAPANLWAIGAAAAINFALNNTVTFARRVRLERAIR